MMTDTNCSFCLLREMPGREDEISLLDGAGRLKLMNKGNCLESIVILGRESGGWTDEKYLMSMDTAEIRPRHMNSLYISEDEMTGFQTPRVTVKTIEGDPATIERDDPFGDDGGQAVTYPYICLRYASPDSPNIWNCREYAGNMARPEEITIHFLAELSTGGEVAEAVYRPAQLEEELILDIINDWRNMQ